MKRLNKQSISKPKMKRVLNDFSLDLYDYMQEINSMGNKKKKQKSLHENNSQKFLLPLIKRQKNNACVKKLKKVDNKIPNIQNKAHKLLVRINQLQKNNDYFWQNKNQKIQLFNSLYSTPKQNNVYPIFQIPPTIYYNINQYPIMPFQFQHYPNYQQPYQNINNNIYRSQIKKPSFVISQARMKHLKRRIRIILIGILFIFVFRTYSKTVIYKRCLASLQLQQIVNKEYKQLQIDLFKCFQKINIYKIFVQCSKKKQNGQQQGNQIIIEHENEQISIDLDVCENFLKEFLNSIFYMIKNGEFNIFKPIIASFLEGSFPLSRVFLEQQIQLIRTHQQFGYLTISAQVSRILIINYFFIKVFVANMLIGKKLQSVLLKIYKKNDKQQKLALLYGKKITIIIVMFYDILNSIYFSSLKKINSNNRSVPPKQNIRPLNELEYQINLNNYIPKQPSKSLIKNIQCPQQIREVFIQKFEKNWIIIKNIAQLLYKSGLDYKKTIQVKVLGEAKQNPFPQRNKLVQIFQQRLIKINEKIYSSQGQNQGGSSQNSFKKTLKNIVKKKK